MPTLYLLSVWIHVLAAATWIGSMVFFAAVVVPTLRDPMLRVTAPDLLRRVGPRFRRLGWVSLGVLVATGVTNLTFRGFGWATLSSGAFWTTPFGTTLARKLALVTAIVLATVAHDLWLGTRAMRVASGTARAETIRKAASWLGRATLLLSLGVLWLAILLARGAG